LQRELGERKGWMNEEQYALAYSLARITPGTNVLAFCAGSAYALRGWAASILAVAAASLPASLISVWLTVAYEAAVANRITKSAVEAMLGAVVGMMAASVLNLLRPSIQRRQWVRILIVTGGTVLLREVVGLSPVQLIGLAALAGGLWREADPE